MRRAGSMPRVEEIFWYSLNQNTGSISYSMFDKIGPGD